MGPGQGSHRGRGRSSSRAGSDRRRIRPGRVREPEPGRVRWVGPSRREKWGVVRVVCGLPSGVPGPSLGGPRIEGPTARHRDEPSPEHQAEADWGDPSNQRGSAGPPARLRYRDNSDIPVFGRARPSGRSGSANGGDRDHRGSPLLQRVGMEYQISYRDSDPRTSPFPRFFNKSNDARALRPATPSNAVEANLVPRLGRTQPGASARP
jgi:hypothetical protein